MSKLKSFDDFVNENLVAKGEYNFYGPGSLMPIVQKLISEGKGESVIRTYLYSIGVAPWRIEKVFNEMNVPEISLEKKMNEGKKMTFEEKATKLLKDINEDEEELDEAAINEFDMPGFWEFFQGGAGWEAGKIAVWMGLALGMVILGGVAATGVSLIAKAKGLYSDYKDKKGAKEALDFMAKSPKVKELIQFSKDLIKQRKKKVDKRRKNSDDDIKALKKVEKQMVKQRQQIGADLVEELKKAKLSEEAIDYLAWNVPYVKTALRMNRLSESALYEVSRWKGKEIYPKWVKPSDIQGYVKSIKDLVDGRDYVLYEPGMDSWQAEYEYVGRNQGDYIFKSSAQFSTSPEERFTGKELAAMIKDLEIAVMEGKEINEKALINKKPKRSIRPHGKVKPGNVAIDYNDEPYTVVGVGTVADLAQFDDSGAAEELDPSEDAIALLGRGGYAVYSYDPDGAVVYEGEIYDQLNEFMVKPLKHDEFDWEFEITDPSDKKLYKALTAAGIEFGTNNGKLTIMGAGKMDNAVPAIKILHKFGIKEGVNEAKKKTFEDAAAAFLLGLGGSDAVNDDKDAKVDEKLNKNTLQVEEGDGEDIDDMIDDLADGDEDETQGPDDEAPDGKDSPEAKIKDGESPEDAVDGAMDDATSKIKDAAEELAKDSKKLAKIKKLLGESKITEDITRMLNDGAMSEIHLLAKDAKDEKDFMKKAKKFVEDMGVKFEKGMETMMKSFWSDMKNESVKETKEVELENGKEVEDKEDIEDEETGDDVQVEEESVSNPYMDAVTEGLKHRFNK